MFILRRKCCICLACKEGSPLDERKRATAGVMGVGGRLEEAPKKRRKEKVEKAEKAKAKASQWVNH